MRGFGLGLILFLGVGNFVVLGVFVVSVGLALDVTVMVSW